MLLAEETVSIGALVLAFINSPVGVSVVSGIVLFILARVWKAKPGWEKVFDEHKGLLFDAVRHAEEAIPNDSKSKAADMTDKALIFLLKMEPSFENRSSVDVRKALDKAHAAVEESKDKNHKRAINTKTHGVDFEAVARPVLPRRDPPRTMRD